MNILYIISASTVNNNNGIKRQAEIWADGLIKMGHNVILFDCWNQPKWETVELIHIFGNGLWLIELVKSLSSFNIPIIVSPIIDTFKPRWIYRLTSFVGIPALRLFSPNYALRFLKDKISCVMVRSNHELQYVNKAYRYSKDKIALLRLPCRLKDTESIRIDNKENFCFHLSAFTQKRKNVMRLMEAAVKYGFQLVIAGSKGSEKDSKPFIEFARKHKNIQIVGEVSENELLRLYCRAKVFALPSIDEGVGFVALEAASLGCKVVITSIGGPKEYYGGMAKVVNPFDIDEIGKSVLDSLNEESDDHLRSWVLSQYNLKRNSKELFSIYEKYIKTLVSTKKS